MNNKKNEVKNNKTDIKLILRLFPYLKQHGLSIFFMYLCAFVNVGTTILIPVLIKYGIDEGILPGNFTVLLRYSTYLLGALLLQFVSLRFQGILIMKTGNSVFYGLRRDLFKHILKLSFSFFDRNKAGSLMTRITSDVEVLEELLIFGMDTLLVDVVMMVGIIVSMLLLDYRLSSILVIIIPLLVLLVFGLQSRIVKAARGIQTELSSVNAYLNESLSGIMVSRAFARENENIRLFKKANGRYYQKTRKFYPLIAFFWQHVVIFNTSSVGLVLLVGGYLLYKDLLTVGVIAAFITYVTRLFQPMQKISEMLNQLSRATASFERIFALLDEKADIKEDPHAVKNIELTGKLEFRDVDFYYSAGTPVLKHLSFTVKSGKTLAIVGATGSGKTTIISLVSRFYDVVSGEVLLDGINIKKITMDDLRSQVAVVMQEPQIFSGTVFENIRFASQCSSLDDVKTVCRMLGIDTMIESFPSGYQTEVGERGSNISIGQKQLLAFARVMLRDPKILILDEASAYLDSKSEALVQQALLKMMEGRTTIVIAHRLSTIRNADTIMVLEQGEIIESGSHEELLEKQGAYKALLEKAGMSES